MKLQLTGQRPTELDPLHRIPIKGDYDPMAAVKSTMVDPLFEPLSTGATVSVQDNSGHSYDSDAVLDLLGRTVAPGVDTDAEEAMKSLYTQALIHYDSSSTLLSNEVFALQAAARKKIPAPTPMIKYTAGSDVRPAAKELLAGRAADADTLLASLSFSYSPGLLGFWFRSESDFDRFKEWMAGQIQQMASILPSQTQKLLTEFSKIPLDGLTETIVLRNDDDQENEELSFARIVVDLLMQYEEVRRSTAAAGSAPESGILPFNVAELFVPKVIALVNVEAHARKSPKRIDSEWRLILNSLNSPIKVVSNRSLSKLTALPRQKAKAAARAANAQTNKFAQSGRSGKVAFRKMPPNKIDLFKGVTRALKKMKEVNRSQNAYKTVKSTFTKPNRRDPDDYNKPGRITSTRYLPDIHIYLDCSGSISEDNYQRAVLMLIQLAKKLNVNLYFNSFSHMMSQEALLKTENRSVARIWRDFRRIPKVTGGTEFSQIWEYINRSPARKGRFSLVITDFEWQPQPHRQEHPKNLHYAPVDNTDWDRMIRAAEMFEKSMRHIEPTVAQRLIGIVK